jgi:dihydrodipicolinate synthase/N-acetylneuraminate lyase
VGQALGGAHGLGAAGDEGSHDSLDGLVEIRRDLMHEPDAECNLRSEPLPGEEVAARGARPDLAEDEGRDDRRDDPEAHLREPKDRVFGCKGDVGAGDEPGTTAERVALHARDDGRRAGIHGLEHAVETHGVLHVLVEREVDGRALPVHVGSRAEAGAFAGEDDGPRGADVGERVRELGDERGVEGVPPLRPRQRDPQDRSVTLGSERAHGAELRVRQVVRGALAAAVTPLRDDGEGLDEDAFGPYVDFLADNRLDGIFALGTTGEGLLLSLEERKRAAQLFVESAGARLGVVVHCGAQTTRDTVALCEHAAELGAGGVAAVGPPYFAFTPPELAAHFRAAAGACAPVPFYIYEFEARAGYAVPLDVVNTLRDELPNLQGLKVSDAPFDRVEPYLIEGLDVFVGSEPLVPQALERGAAGTVSGLAAAFPDVVADLVAGPSLEAGERVTVLREALQRFPFVAAAKAVLGRRGLPIRGDVRAPLLPLTLGEGAELFESLDAWLASP